MPTKVSRCEYKFDNPGKHWTEEKLFGKDLCSKFRRLNNLTASGYVRKYYSRHVHVHVFFNLFQRICVDEWSNNLLHKLNNRQSKLDTRDLEHNWTKTILHRRSTFLHEIHILKRRISGQNMIHLYVTFNISIIKSWFHDYYRVSKSKMRSQLHNTNPISFHWAVYIIESFKQVVYFLCTQKRLLV